MGTNDKNIKISFTGDILCSMIQNELCCKDGKYDYSPIFDNVRSELRLSDFFCGNLKTTISGKELTYTNNSYSFNTPDSFLDAVKSVSRLRQESEDFFK